MLLRGPVAQDAKSWGKRNAFQVHDPRDQTGQSGHTTQFLTPPNNPFSEEFSKKLTH